MKLRHSEEKRERLSLSAHRDLYTWIYLSQFVHGLPFPGLSAVVHNDTKKYSCAAR